jgi:BRCT domain type II-containing protein
MSDAEGWDWIYANASPRREKLPSICFTGFGQAEKDELSTQAIAARFRIVPSVNGSLAFLCAGESAGPVKMARAKQFGITLLTRTQFEALLETGEIPA